MAEIENQLKRIKAEDVCGILKRKFDVERMHRFFTVDSNFIFQSHELNLTPSNSMLLRFLGLDNEHPYNMLLVFELADREDFSFSLQNQIRRVAENNIDKIVIWIKRPVDADVVHSLKLCNTNIICISNAEIEGVNFISNFYPYGSDYNYAVIINKLTDLIVVRLKKLFHLVLSEIAAPSYDSDYGANKIGTKSIMDFEEEILNRTINHLSWQRKSRGQVMDVAVDVGCGTGRHSLVVLAPYFKNVFGFDFSPKMIEVANIKKKKKGLGHVVFSVADLEYEEITYEEEFIGRSDLVVASFGMGSFIEDTAKMLRRFHEWLKPGGMLFLSMYNRNSVLLNLTPNWRDTSLSAHIDVENNTLQVELTPGTVFQIFCKSYDNTVKTEIAKKFDILNIYHYPITLALLPNTFLQEPLAKELFTHIDKALCSDKEFFLGHYVLLIAKKPEGADIDGYKNVLMVLEEHKIQYDILEHDMVLSINDVVREIGRQEGIMIKTLVFYCEDTKRYAIVALPHDKKINKARFAKQLGVHHKKLKFASEKKIVELGFPLGGIPPFGFPSDQNIEYFIDPSLKVVSSTNVFMGVGDNKKTLKLKSHDFCKLIQNYRELVLPSKAPGDK